MDLRLRTDSPPAPATDPTTAGKAVTDTPPAGKPAPASGKDLPPAAAPTAVSIEQAVAQIQDYLRTTQRELNFQLDEASGRTVIRVVDPASGELVRQIPSKEVLSVAAAIEAGRLRLLDDLA